MAILLKVAHLEIARDDIVEGRHHHQGWGCDKSRKEWGDIVGQYPLGGGDRRPMLVIGRRRFLQLLKEWPGVR